MFDRTVIKAIKAAAVPLHGTTDTDAIMAAIGDASIVLLGEATHGTHEFYRSRMEISMRLARRAGREPLRTTARRRHAAGRAGRLRTLPALDVAQRRRAGNGEAPARVQ